MLFSIHKGMVAVTKCPEFDLEADDAKKLGEAVAGVMAFHKIKMTAKQEAYAILMEAAAEVYPPMLATLYIRKLAEAESRKKSQPPARPVAVPPSATVLPIRPAPSTATPGFDPFNISVPEG